MLIGCGHAASPGAGKRAHKKPTVAEVRLGVLPPDAMPFADLATALGTQLRHIETHTSRSARTEVVLGKVSMEVAQLSLECVTPTTDCYAAVGKFLQVDRLLWGQLVRDDDKQHVKVTVVLLDVALGTGIGRAERSFPEHGASPEELQKVIDEAMGAAHDRDAQTAGDGRDTHVPPSVAAKSDHRS